MPPVQFDQLQTVEHLALVWGAAKEDLEAIAAAGDQSGFYLKMEIPKAGKKNRGKCRTVFKARWGVLKQLQKNLARDIGASVSFPDSVHGFVAGRSTITNATIHLGQRVLLHADIENFFDTITTDQVTTAFVGLGCCDNIAALLARCCTLNGRLPQGASTSPIIANLVCRALDADLLNYASPKARYSRYADDLTFSGDTPPSIDAIRRIVQAHGFALREDKVRTQWRGKSQYVTGLSIADPHGPRVPARMKRRLRLEFYYATKYGLQDHQERGTSEFSNERLRQYWRGWVDYLHSIPAERSLAERLGKQLDKIPE